MKLFKPPTLFGNAIETAFINMIKKPNETEKSWIVNWVNQSGDEKLDQLVKKRNN